MRELVRNHKKFVDYLQKKGFLKVTRLTNYERYWKAPPDLIRVKDGKPFEVKSVGNGPDNQLIYAIGQPLVFRCMYGDGGIIYPKEIKLWVLEKNKELGNPFERYKIEVLFL